MHNLFPPLIVGDVQTAAGRREIGVVAGVSDNIYGIDVEKGTQIWKRHFDSTLPSNRRAAGAYPLCPGGLTATPVIAPDRHAGQVHRLRDLVGRPAAPARRRHRRGARAAEPFLPPNGKPYGLNLYNNVLYTTTAQGCGGNPNQFYAYDLATKKVGSFNPGSGGLWPRLGPSIGKDGSVYAGSGDGDYFPEQQIYGQAIIAVKQNPEDQSARAEGLVRAVERRLAAQARPRHERDRAGLRLQGQGIHRPVEQGVPDLAARHDARSAAKTTARRSTGRRSSATRKCSSRPPASGARSRRGRTSNGTRWVLMPFWGPKHSQFKAPIEHGEVVHGAIAAFKLEEQGRQAAAVARVALARHVQADPSVIANGVVFGYGSGEDATQADAGHRPRVQHGGEPRRRIRRTRRSTRSTRGPARSCGRAAIRSPRSTTSRACRSPTAASTSARTTACSMRSAWTEPRPARNERRTRQMNRTTRAVLCVCACCVGRRLCAGTRGQRRMDDERPRRAAHGVDPERRAADEGGRAEGRVPVSLEGKFDNDARQLNSLTQPVLLDRLIGFRGFKALAFVGGSADRDLRDRHRPRPSVLDDGPELLGEHRRSAGTVVGLSGRAHRDAEPPHGACPVGIRRRRWRW